MTVQADFKMPNSLRFLEDFILPALNEGRYGDLLKWDLKEQNVFLLKWKHKGGSSWSEKDTVVFQGWDILKGHYRPDDPKYLCQSKQRFRSALYKLNQFEELKPIEVNAKCYFKRYRIKEFSTRKVRKNQRQNLQRVPSEACMNRAWPIPVVLERIKVEDFGNGYVQMSPEHHQYLDSNQNLPVAEEFQNISSMVGVDANQCSPSHQCVEVVSSNGALLNHDGSDDSLSLSQENFTSLQNMQTVNLLLDDDFLNFNIPLNELLLSTFPHSPYGDNLDINCESDDVLDQL